MPEIPKEKLTELVTQLKAKHPGRELHLLGAKGHQVIAAVPSRAEYQEFKDMAASPDKQTRAVEHLARTSVLYPEPEAFDQLLEQYPGLGTSFGAKLQELAGATEDVEAKKL